MKVTATPSERSTVVLEVELPPERVARSIDQSVRQLGRRTRVPGFRPGKVPRPMLERALGVRRGEPDGPNPIYDEAKDQLFEQTVVEAIKESDLDVLDLPRPDWVRFAEGEGAAYRVAIPVQPRVELGDYAGFPFGPEIEPIDDARVEKVVDDLRDQNATLVPVEDRGAEKGDHAVIAFEATREGQPLEGGSAERFPLVIGEEGMIPGFEDQLIGLREGEDKSFDLVFPEDYPDESLRAATVAFHATLMELREKRLPAADDDLARTLGQYDDLAALREEIRARLERNARDRARHAFADRIIEYAVANATLEVPDLLVEREVEVMHDELRMRLMRNRIGYEEYLKISEKDDAKIHAEYRPDAEHRVRVLQVLDAVAEQEATEVTDAEVEAEVAGARERYAKDRKMVDYFESERGRRYVRSTLRRSKVVEQLIDRWLEAHPEAGPLPHLETAEDGTAEDEVPSPVGEAVSEEVAAE